MRMTKDVRRTHVNERRRRRRRRCDINAGE
jgi:hypothetical protein